MAMVRRTWRRVEPVWHRAARIAGSRAAIVSVSVLAGLFVVGLITWAAVGRTAPVLETAGTIAHQQRDLIYLTIILGAVVVIPVYILLFVIGWRYRATNLKATYDPTYHGNNKLEIIWWGIPIVIIAILSVVTFISTHALDPYKPLQSDKRPVQIQVISLQWKWLFIYPELGVASVNEMNIPADRPINLTLTSDAPMNSFWVPALAGQIYTMNGMSTRLHLMADAPGRYDGFNTNISGDGYADMQFTVTAQSEGEFTDWIARGNRSADILTWEAYQELAEPSRNPPHTLYLLGDARLYNNVVMQYMGHGMGESH